MPVSRDHLNNKRLSQHASVVMPQLKQKNGYPQFIYNGFWIVNSINLTVEANTRGQESPLFRVEPKLDVLLIEYRRVDG